MSRRRDSTIHGFITVKLLEYDIFSQEYAIEIENATLISTANGSIRLKVPKRHVNQLLINLNDSYQSNKSYIPTPFEEANNMDDSEIDHVLDEILETEEYDETEEADDTTNASYSKDENQYLVTLKKQLNKEIVTNKWSEICCMNSENEHKTDNEMCTNSIQECDCIQRIIFMLNYYQLWCQYKAFIKLEEDYNDSGYEYLCSMSSFIEILNGYNKIKLINDFIHIKESHKVDRVGLKQYINEIIPNQCEYDEHNDIICQFTNRIHQKSEIYKFSQEHDDLDIIEMYNLNLNNLEYASVDEINEINLQNYLDIIHSNLLHDAMAVNKDKYTTKIPINYISDSTNGNDVNKINKLNKLDIVDVGNYEFGMFFNYWSVNNHHYCAPKYKTLKQELLNNKLYSISLNDYILIENKAYDFLDSEYGERLTLKRLFAWMKKKDTVKIGDKISVEHLISLIIYCNYNALREAFVYMGCFKYTKREKEADVKKRNVEISNWCRLLMECVYCFGDILLNNSDKLYHGIDCKLSVNRMDFQFDCPLSVTNNISVLVRHKNDTQNEYKDNNIYLQLEKILNSKDICNFYLDLSNLSSFPAENEFIIFGAKLACTDIIFDRLSHKDYILCLRLYQKLLIGEWFNDDIEYDQELLHDRYQRRLMKMLNQMIHKRSSNGANKYMRYLCESITKNISFGRKMIWLNRNECNKHLLPQFKQLLFNPFIKYIFNTYIIKTKFCNILELNINIENDLNKSSRKKTICSREFKYKLNGNSNDAIVFHFRCFKQFSKIKNDEMFNGYLGIKSMPKEIGMVKIYGGTYIQQILFEKWNYFYLSHSKLNHGGALFSTDKLVDIKNLNIKICFQIWGIVSSDGNANKI